VTTARGLQKAEAQVADAVSHGGTVVLGGKNLHASDPATYPGYFFEPTIIAGANAEMLVSREETFAPVLAVYEFSTEDEAVEAANATDMGLASYFFTSDVHRSWRLYEKLDAGMVGINCGGCSAAESPFGGIKDSGFGKESGKDVAIAEYLVTKTGTMIVDGHY